MKLAAFAFLLSCSAAFAGPVDCSGTVVTGGTAVPAIAAGTNLQGFRIVNLDTTEALWFSMTGSAAAVATVGSSPLASGTATTFAGVGSFSTPDTLHPNTGLSVNATTSGHKFTCSWW